MKILKKNQVIIYVIALMLVAAGYLNYTSTQANNAIETSLLMEGDDMQLANIGDAQLVSSSEVVENVASIENTTNGNEIDNTNVINEGIEDITNKTSEEQAVNETVETNSDNSNEYFVKSKLERDTMYSQMLETYEKVLNSANSLETQKQTATQEITKINETKNCIMICENLIQTKGFENNVIFVNGESISVIIGAKEITQEEVAQIQNIISREMKAEIENIHISTK